MVRPSTTCPISAAASAGVAPRAISSPARRFRPWRDQQVTIRSPMPASPANVSGRAPHASPSRAISARPRVISAALPLSPRPTPSTPPAASAITFLAAAQSSTPVTSGLTYTRKTSEVIACWSSSARASSSLAITAARRQAPGDLLREVRAREHRHRPAADERREALAAARVEALRQAEHGRRPRELGDDVAEGTARNGDHDDVGVPDRGRGDGRRLDACQRHVGQVARIAAGLCDRPCLVGVAGGERDFVTAVGEQAREGRPPGAGPDDDRSQDRRTKSIDTGTPSRSNSSRRRFSTQ